MSVQHCSITALHISLSCHSTPAQNPLSHLANNSPTHSKYSLSCQQIQIHTQIKTQIQMKMKQFPPCSKRLALQSFHIPPQLQNAKISKLFKYICAFFVIFVLVFQIVLIFQFYLLSRHQVSQSYQKLGQIAHKQSMVLLKKLKCSQKPQNLAAWRCPLLAPTGALIVMMCYYISAAAAATFSDFHSVH